MVELMKIPKTTSRIVSPAEDVEELMNKFFINTKEYLEEKFGKENYIEIKRAFLNEKIGACTGEKINYVKYQNKYIVAGMIETRTAFNDLQFTFFRDLNCLENII